MIKRIWVDADAIPRGVSETLRRLQAEFGYELITVSSYNHVNSGESHLTVDAEDQATDLAIINQLQAGELVVTQDWGLAALVLGKRALALSPKGREFTEDNIDFMLAERHIKASLRRRGKYPKGSPARTADDDKLFESALRRILQ